MIEEELSEDLLDFVLGRLLSKLGSNSYHKGKQDLGALSVRMAIKVTRISVKAIREWDAKTAQAGKGEE